MRKKCAILPYALVKGFNLNVGKIVEQSILDYLENNFLRNIPHHALITLLYIKGIGGGGGGVTFSEKCSRSSPITLTGALKAPVQGEEVERIRKRKRATSELKREATLTIEEELETEEKGGVGGGGGVFEDYPEQQVLSPRAEENIMPTQNKTERGNMTAKEQESNTLGFFSLLTEMREEMKRRDEQFKEELRWRDETQAVENKRREENLAAVLQQRDEKWREELSQKDKALRVELKEREKAIVQDQLMRDQELIKLMEVREKEME